LAQWIKLIFLFSITLILNACGGGGGGESAPESSPVPVEPVSQKFLPTSEGYIFSYNSVNYGTVNAHFSAPVRKGNDTVVPLNYSSGSKEYFLPKDNGVALKGWYLPGVTINNTTYTNEFLLDDPITLIGSSPFVAQLAQTDSKSSISGQGVVTINPTYGDVPFTVSSGEVEYLGPEVVSTPAGELVAEHVELALYLSARIDGVDLNINYHVDYWFVAGVGLVKLVNNGETFSLAGITGSDSDGDGLPNLLDAFPSDSNEQSDSDGDGIGNNADKDDDNDGVEDTADAFPYDPSESVDTDGDGIGNNVDPDIDNDYVANDQDDFPELAARQSKISLEETEFVVQKQLKFFPPRYEEYLYIEINNKDQVGLDFNSDVNWLTVASYDPWGRRAPFSIDWSMLELGDHRGVITISDPDDDTSYQVEVIAQLTAPVLTLEVNDPNNYYDDLPFTGFSADKANSEVVTLKVDGSTVKPQFSIVDKSLFLSLEETSSASSYETEYLLRLNPFEVEPDVNEGYIEFTLHLEDRDLNQVISFPVNSTLPLIYADTAAVGFSKFTNTEALSHKVLLLSSNDQAPSRWQVSTEASWLNIAVDGSGFTLTADPLNLSANHLHETIVTVTATGYKNSVVEIPVALWIGEGEASSILSFETANSYAHSVYDSYRPYVYKINKIIDGLYTRYDGSVDVYNYYTGELVSSYVLPDSIFSSVEPGVNSFRDAQLTKDGEHLVLFDGENVSVVKTANMNHFETFSAHRSYAIDMSVVDINGQSIILFRSGSFLDSGFDLVGNEVVFPLAYSHERGALSKGGESFCYTIYSPYPTEIVQCASLYIANLQPIVVEHSKVTEPLVGSVSFRDDITGISIVRQSLGLVDASYSSISNASGEPLWNHVFSGGEDGVELYRTIDKRSKLYVLQLPGYSMGHTDLAATISVFHPLTGLESTVEVLVDSRDSLDDYNKVYVSADGLYLISGSRLFLIN